MCIQFCVIFSLVPASPVISEASPASYPGQLKVTWTSPGVDLRPSILQYLIQYKPSNSSDGFLTVKLKSLQNFAKISGLHLGTSYIIRVAATNELGTSAYSDSVYATTFNSKLNWVTMHAEL